MSNALGVPLDRPRQKLVVATLKLWRSLSEQRRVFRHYLGGLVRRGVRQGHVDNEKIPDGEAAERVFDEAHLVVEVAEGVAEHGEDAAPCSPVGRLEEVHEAGQAVEVARDHDHGDLEVLEGLGGVVVRGGQQRLADVDHEQAQVHRIMGGDLLDELDLMVAGADSEGDDVQRAAASLSHDRFGDVLRRDALVRVDERSPLSRAAWIDVQMRLV